VKYVTVVYIEDPRTDRGQLASFVDETPEASIASAIKARRDWQRNGRPYRLLTGTLDTEVIERPTYEFKKLRTKKRGR
jgi:hypothetical protein